MAKRFYEKDGNLSDLQGKPVAIVGYGSQGHAHALNLRDSGIDVVVGLYKGSKSWQKAEAAGLKVLSVADASKAAQVVMILVSDLLAPIDALERNLISLTASGHEVVLFHVLDPAELAFDFDNAAMFHDVESGRDLYIDPAMARKEYQRKMQVHMASARSACQKLGIAYLRFATDRPMELSLFDFLRARMQRGRKAKHSGRARGGKAG